MITMSHVSKTYAGHIQALKGVGLEIREGMFGLIGPNGAGKTTLLRALSGLLRPTSGEIQVFGHDLKTRRGRQAAKALLGYLPQELGLYPDLSAYEFLEYIAVLKGVPGDQIREQITELARRVGLTSVIHRRMKTFSGGMKRRVGIAQALLGHPKVLIVDEPTAGLDPEERVHLRNLLAEFARDCTIILSTHIVEDISLSCNDLAVLQEGEIIFRGNPRQLVEAARGQVWHVTTAGERPDSRLMTISTLPLESGVQYRVLGSPKATYRATPVEPSLEDGYLWLMQQHASPRV